MNLSFIENNEPILLKRFKLWAKLLTAYVNAYESVSDRKYPIKSELNLELPKWLSVIGKNLGMHPYYEIEILSEKIFIPFTFCPAIAEARERPFPPFMYRTFLLRHYEYKSYFGTQANLFADICNQETNSDAVFFELINDPLNRFLPVKFQPSDGSIIFVNNDETLTIYFSDNNKRYSFELNLPSDRKFSYITFASSETREQIKRKLFKKRMPIMTPFERDTKIQNYIIRKNKHDNISKILRATPENMKLKEVKKYNSLTSFYMRTIRLSTSVNDNLFNLIIRGIQTHALDFNDSANRRLILKLLRVESLIKAYDRKFDQLRDGKSLPEIEIIYAAITNCKLQVTIKGFKRLIRESLKNQLCSVDFNLKVQTNNKKNRQDDLPPNWLNRLDAYGFFKIKKDTFYRKLKENKNDTNKVDYAQKLLSRAYCEDISKEFKDRNNRVENNRQNISDLSDHYGLPINTIKKHLRYYLDRFKKEHMQTGR